MSRTLPQIKTIMMLRAGDGGEGGGKGGRWEMRVSVNIRPAVGGVGSDPT